MDHKNHKKRATKRDFFSAGFVFFKLTGSPMGIFPSDSGIQFLEYEKVKPD